MHFFVVVVLLVRGLKNKKNTLKGTVAPATAAFLLALGTKGLFYQMEIETIVTLSRVTYRPGAQVWYYDFGVIYPNIQLTCIFT